MNGICADRRQAEGLSGLGCCQRLNDGLDNRLRLWITGLRVELWRWQNEHRVRTGERAGQRRSIVHVGEREFATLRDPCSSSARVTHDCADRLAGREQCASKLAADLAGDAGDGVHRRSPITFGALLFRKRVNRAISLRPASASSAIRSRLEGTGVGASPARVAWPRVWIRFSGVSDVKVPA